MSRVPSVPMLARLDAGDLEAGYRAATRAAAWFDQQAAAEMKERKRAKWEKERDNCQKGAAAFLRELDRRAKEATP